MRLSFKSKVLFSLIIILHFASGTASALNSGQYWEFPDGTLSYFCELNASSHNTTLNGQIPLLHTSTNGGDHIYSVFKKLTASINSPNDTTLTIDLELEHVSAEHIAICDTFLTVKGAIEGGSTVFDFSDDSGCSALYKRNSSPARAIAFAPLVVESGNSGGVSCYLTFDVPAPILRKSGNAISTSSNQSANR